MNKNGFQVNVILASRPSIDGPDLITVHCRYPRMIHSEVMTHRVFSKNARSSRAVPTKKLINEDIYVPHFLKNKPGMQATEEFSSTVLENIQNAWIEFAQRTQEFQSWLAEMGVHKQWANRPGEWFGWIDTLITSTEWSNWFDLRNHDAAAPEINTLAQLMDAEFERALQENNLGFQVLKPGQWHIPYISREEMMKLMNDNEVNSDYTKKTGIVVEPSMALKLSVARCARISYEPFDGNGSLEKELERHDLLRNANPIHASPFEHQAKVVDNEQKEGLIWKVSNLAYPWLQYRKVIGE